MSNGVKFTIGEEENETMFEGVELEESPYDFLYFVI